MATGTYRDLVGFSGFRALLWTQFLGAFNDNLFKIAPARDAELPQSN